MRQGLLFVVYLVKSSLNEAGKVCQNPNGFAVCDHKNVEEGFFLPHKCFKPSKTLDISLKERIGVARPTVNI